MSLSSVEAHYENGKHLRDRKGKKKVCNLGRHGRDKFQERLDFKFYDFQALEIEKGWNNLFVSIVSTETGETIAKSGKASVQNGKCHWEDSMLSTMWISHDSFQHHESFLLKLVVAMGSARFGTLGEATINLASYITPEISTASLSLRQHCSHGTILQVKIQCLTPRSKHRKEANSYVEEMSVCSDDVDSTSDVSDNTFSRTSGSSHWDHLENTYHRRELSSKRISPLATCSDHDIGSSLSFWIGSPQKSNVSGLEKKMNEKQDSTYSENSPCPLYETSGSMYSSPVTSSSGTRLQGKIEELGKVSHASDTTLTRSVGSSKDLLGVAQVTIDLLHGEAKMWEENATKLMVDVERLRKHLHKKSKNKKELEMQLSASRKETDALKEEIQLLTSMLKQNDSRNLKFQIEEMDNTIKELKDEIKYQKELNCDLEFIMKTQESKVDLVSILQKLEKIKEKQKMKIADLSTNCLRFSDAEINSQVIEDSEEEDFSLSKEVLPEKMRKELCYSDFDLGSCENAIRCLHEGIELQEFRNLELEHRLMQEKHKNMESTIQILEKTLNDKDHEIQRARCFMAQTLEENEAKCRSRLFEKGKQIINFENKLSEDVYAFGNEILSLTQRVQDLEAEYCEKLEESRKDLIISGSFSSNFPLFDSDSSAINITEVFHELYKQLKLSVEKLRGQDSVMGQMTLTKNENCFSISDLSKDTSNIDLKKLTEAILCTIILLKNFLETKATSFEYEINSQDELVGRKSRNDNVFRNEVRDCSEKENIFYISSQELRNIQAKLMPDFPRQVESAETNKLKSVSMPGNEKSNPRYSELELETEVAHLQSKISSSCSTDFPNYMKFHYWTKDSHSLISKDHVRNPSFESCDDEGSFLFGLEAEKVQLSERMFGFETDMTHLIEEKESAHLALENSENLVKNLQAEIRRMEELNEAQKVELKRKEERMNKKWIEAQEECSFLKVANLELQATNEKLIEESKTLQTTNDELRMQNLELHSQCTVLDSKLGESHIAFSDMLKLVEELEYKFTSILEEIALKEKNINVDLEFLLEESRKLDERFIIEEKFLTQTNLEKTAEVGYLQREVEHLSDQISGICYRHKRMASNIVLEVYDLCADKAMIEAALQQEQVIVRLLETKFDNLEAEYKVMLQNYTEELAVSRANQETLVVNHEKVVVLLENLKSNEEKLKRTVRGLEVELKASELERLQATEEISELEVQLQKTEMLQNEIFILKSSLYEAEFEFRRLEASYQMLSLEFDELKAKNVSQIRRISTIEKVTSEFEDCKRSKIELEEKILRLQWNLKTNEASCHNNAQLKYEIAQMKKENGELHRKKDFLQQENEEYKNKVKDLEERLKQKKDVKEDRYDARDSTTSTLPYTI